MYLFIPSFIILVTYMRGKEQDKQSIQWGTKSLQVRPPFLPQLSKHIEVSPGGRIVKPI